VAISLESTGRLDEAIEQLQRTIEIDPRFEVAHTFLGRVYFHTGNREAGLRQFEKSVEMTGRESRPLGFLGYGYARSGRRDQALQIAGELEERYKKHAAGPFSIAYIYLGLDDRQQTYRWIERAIDEHDPNVIGVGGYEFDALRSDPAFQQLMRKMNLPAE